MILKHRTKLGPSFGTLLKTTRLRLDCLVPGQHLSDHLFLFLHVGTTEAATRIHQNIRRDFMFLGKMLKGSAQVVLSLVLPIGDWDPRRRQHTDQVNDWLRSQCHVQDFGFCDLRCDFERLDTVTYDGVHLTKWLVIT